MRKSALLFLTLLVLSVSAQPISEQEALQKARQFLQGKNIVRPSQGQIRRAAKARPYQHLYLFNVENDGGFVVVSGDSRAREILAYGEEGSLDYEQMPDNMKWWLSLYDESIANLPADMSAAQARAVQRASKSDITPMMNYSWSQSSPFNAYCPQNCVAGCVPLALAQMLAYHRYPSTLPSMGAYTDASGHYLESLGSRSVDYSNLTYDDAAWMVRYAGQALRVDYDQSSSSAPSASIPSVLVNRFGYSQGVHNIYRDAYKASDWDDLLYTGLLIIIFW